MNFQPVVPFGGFAGWSFLQRTMVSQKKAFDQSAAMNRDIAYFRDNISKVTSAEALVADRRLLGVALGAFGLDSDINNRYFIKKVLSDGTLTNDALANKLADKRYLKLSQAFGFGDFSVPNTQLSDFADGIVKSYRTRQFEIAVGDQNPDMRLAMNLSRELGDLAASSSGDNTKWYSVMGSIPLRKVFETAFGLPSAFGALNIDKQLDIFRQRASRSFGNGEVSQFQDPAKIAELVRRFLVRSDLNNTASSYSPASTALILLQDAAN